MFVKKDTSHVIFFHKMFVTNVLQPLNQRLKNVIALNILMSSLNIRSDMPSKPNPYSNEIVAGLLIHMKVSQAVSVTS